MTEGLQTFLDIASEQGFTFVFAIASGYIAYRYAMSDIDKRDVMLRRRYDLTDIHLIASYVENKAVAGIRDDIEYLRSVLLINHISGREQEVERKIRIELERRLKDFVGALDTLDTPYGKIGEAYESLVDFESIFREIKEVFFRKKKPTSQAPTCADLEQSMEVFIKTDEIWSIILDHHLPACKKLISLLKSRKKD